MKNLQIAVLGFLAVAALAVTGMALSYHPAQPEPVPAAATYTPPPIHITDDRPLAMFIGDSWVGGSAMGGNGWNNFSYIVAGRMDWRFAEASRGGSGYIRPVQPLGTFSGEARMARVKEAQPTYTFVVNGINDWQEHITKEELAAAATKTYDAILAAAPKTKLIVIGMMAPGAPTANTLAARDVLKPLVEARHGLFIDPVTDPWWDGEDEKYVGTDKYHLTDAGHEFLAKKLEAILRKALV
ncbi:SGNH/GDSL hydrolase family protein [Arthrobacter sp. NPDC056727]|uniref:SGNH/GDSL hydrolase family protein n=1 Tax=Arthrobacter sp. NPDC056727 TaxID=3345927 RepID=UPI00366E87CD